MKRLALLILMLVGAVVFADPILQNANTAIGPVKAIDCRADGGLLCWRDAGSIGELQCAAASATATGCVTLSAQTFAGDKTFTGDPRVVGHAHGSLTACDASHKGTWQTCTTHNTPVFCNGTVNIETLGSSSLVTLASLNVNRLVHTTAGYLGSFTLPYAFTVTSITGIIGNSPAGTTVDVKVSDGTSDCTATITCTTGAIAAAAGNCTYVASTPVAVTIANDGCTTPITIYEDLHIAGYRL